jgi:hypothetical protein
MLWTDGYSRALVFSVTRTAPTSKRTKRLTRAEIDATKAEAKRQAERAAKYDGDRYGLEITVCGRSRDSMTAHIVRTTATTLVDSNGRVYARKDGARRGDYKFGQMFVSRESLAALEQFLTGRAKVDIVAERKAAALTPADPQEP